MVELIDAQLAKEIQKNGGRSKLHDARVETTCTANPNKLQITTTLSSQPPMKTFSARCTTFGLVMDKETDANDARRS